MNERIAHPIGGFSRKKWSWREESNPRPADYKSEDFKFKVISIYLKFVVKIYS